MNGEDEEDSDDASEDYDEAAARELLRQVEEDPQVNIAHNPVGDRIKATGALDKDTGPPNSRAGRHHRQQASEEEKEQLREEFFALMRERFLRGEDQDFEYRICDRDCTLDAHSRWKERDEEDAYFDDDDGYDI